MLQPTAPLGRSLRRLALTTKQGPKDYYKGTGSGSMGQHTQFGGYRVDYAKVRTYVPPNYDDIEGLEAVSYLASKGVLVANWVLVL